MEDLKAALTPIFEKNGACIAAAYLFGSCAKNEATPGSDLDLGVLLHAECAKGQTDLRLDLYADCCRALRRNDLDIVLLNRTGNLFLLEDIVRNGVVLYDADPDFREEFEVKVMHDFIEFRDHRKKVLGV